MLENLYSGRYESMDVRLITAGTVQQRSVDDLTGLLARDDGLVWVDIPSCDTDAERVLSEVFGLHPMAVHDCAGCVSS